VNCSTAMKVTQKEAAELSKMAELRCHGWLRILRSLLAPKHPAPP
jgi:hypothetical protein